MKNADFLTKAQIKDRLSHMTDFPPIDDAKMYRLAEVSARTGHDQRKLRRWAKLGYLEGARREGAAPDSPFILPGKTVRKLVDDLKGTE